MIAFSTTTQPHCFWYNNIYNQDIMSLFSIRSFHLSWRRSQPSPHLDVGPEPIPIHKVLYQDPKSSWRKTTCFFNNQSFSSSGSCPNLKSEMPSWRLWTPMCFWRLWALGAWVFSTLAEVFPSWLASSASRIPGCCILYHKATNVLTLSLTDWGKVMWQSPTFV